MRIKLLKRRRGGNATASVDFYASETGFNGTLHGGHKPQDPLLVCATQSNASVRDRLSCGVAAIGGLELSSFGYWFDVAGINPKTLHPDNGRYAVIDQGNLSFEQHELVINGTTVASLGANEVNDATMNGSFWTVLGLVDQNNLMVAAGRILLKDTVENRPLFADAIRYFQDVMGQTVDEGGSVLLQRFTGGTDHFTEVHVFGAEPGSTGAAATADTNRLGAYSVDMFLQP